MLRAIKEARDDPAMTNLRISPLVVSALFETSERARNLAVRLDTLSHARPPRASPDGEPAHDAVDGDRLRDELRDTRATLEYVRAQLQELATAMTDPSEAAPESPTR